MIVRAPSILVACLLPAIGITFATAQPPGPPPSASGGDRDPALTNDTAAFCEHLARMVAGLRGRGPVANPDADLLLDDGRQLCAMGHFRQGILRLRHAWMRLRPPERP